MFKILKTFYKFIAKKKFLLVVFWILLIISPILSSLSPYFYKLFVDNIASLEIKTLTNILLIFVLVKFADLLVGSIRFVVGDILALNANKDAQETVFKHIHLLDFSYHTTKSSGSLISVMKRGDSAFWNLYFSIHYRIVAVIVKFLMMLFFFSSIDVRILIFGIASFLVGVLVSFIFVKYNVRYRKEVNEQEDDISSVIVDNMINFETVKLFSKENWEQERLGNKFNLWKKKVWKYVLTFRGLDIGLGTVVNLSTFAILYFALKLTVLGNISVGDFVLVATFLSMFFEQLFELVWGLRDIAKSYSDIERFFEILDISIEVKDPDQPKNIEKVKGEIKYENVSFSYEKNANDAIKNINIDIRQGQSIALVGKSGSGKTTLVKLLLRFFDVDKGKITLDGIDVRDMTKDNLRKNFGVVPQEPVLFNNTIKYNIAYGNPKADKKEVTAASKMANIHEFIMSLPEKYKTQVGERGIKLSGGQKQRIAIARMILSDPDIIIFDEATSQLDSVSEKLIQDAFWKASKGKTTIIIAHRLSTVKKADKIIVLDKGKIIEQGSHKSLVSEKGSTYHHFWNLQVKLRS